MNRLKKTWKSYQQNQCGRLAAALAYYTLFSCVPLVLLVVALVGLIARNPEVEKQILQQALNVLGPAASEGLRALLGATKHPGRGILASLFGFSVMAWGATSLVSQLQYSLNQIWGVRVRSDLGWKTELRRRAHLLLVVLVAGGVLLVSQLASTLLAALPAWIEGVPILWSGLEELISLLILSALFTGLFVLLPDVQLRAGQVFPGALLTATLFLIGRWALNLYLSGGALTSAYGAAASLVILLLWCNYSAQIVFFGAEFTKIMILEQGEIYAAPEGEFPSPG